MAEVIKQSTHPIWHALTSRTALIVVGWLAFAAVVLIGADLLGLAPVWMAAMLGLSLALMGGLFLWHWHARRRASGNLADMVDGQVSPVPSTPDPALHQAHDLIKQRTLDAIATIKGSKLGQLSGDAALYELPWYMVIGNSAAGKSTVIASSGLHFPFANSKIVQGVGGTRNCDWFFTTDGILLDTAGRYAVVEEDQAEWFGFLALLKKYRRKAPINGIIIAVSVVELTGNRPEFAINLAKNLRQRVQELTERLEVHAPVYVVFTKADLITGFNAFFHDTESAERDRVWGATLPYSQSTTGEQVLDQFDKRFDELYDGLKDISAANMALHRRERMPPGIFAFPLEFSAIKAPLRSFIATLFEENPFQFKPVFRGFYFTSALQEGESVSVPASMHRVAQRFDLDPAPQQHEAAHNQSGFFLLDLFRKVIFADKDLVAQYASPNKLRLRTAAFFAATALVGLALGGWSWSYMGNRQLVDDVASDLRQVVQIQANRNDLQSRFQAMQILQVRLEQLEDFRDGPPLSLRLGLYQGDRLEEKVRKEYFNGIEAIMLQPIGRSLENYLTEYRAQAGTPKAAAPAPVAPTPTPSAPQLFKDALPGSDEEAYNALKTYLMLSDRSRAEAGHLNDQLARFWRAWLEANRGAMPREQMIRSAERMISFYQAQVQETTWPTLEVKLALVEQSRDALVLKRGA